MKGFALARQRPSGDLDVVYPPTKPDSGAYRHHATNPRIATPSKMPRPLRISKTESCSRCGRIGMPKSSSARASCEVETLARSVSARPQEGHSLASPLVKSSWQKGHAMSWLTADV